MASNRTKVVPGDRENGPGNFGKHICDGKTVNYCSSSEMSEINQSEVPVLIVTNPKNSSDPSSPSSRFAISPVTVSQRERLTSDLESKNSGDLQENPSIEGTWRSEVDASKNQGRKQILKSSGSTPSNLGLIKECTTTGEKYAHIYFPNPEKSQETVPRIYGKNRYSNAAPSGSAGSTLNSDSELLQVPSLPRRASESQIAGAALGCKPKRRLSFNHWILNTLHSSSEAKLCRTLCRTRCRTSHRQRKFINTYVGWWNILLASQLCLDGESVDSFKSAVNSWLLRRRLDNVELAEMVSLSFTSLTTLMKRDDFTAFSAFLNNRNVALDDRDDNGTTALMVAAEMGKPNFIHSLIEYGASVNLSDLDNWTALHNATKEGHISSMIELLDAGANMEARDMGGWSPLMWAVYRHHESAVHLLLERGASASCVGHQHVSALALASGRGDTTIVSILLEHGAKTNLNDKFGTSPLIWACRKGNTDIVKQLIGHSANVDASGMYSWTPLLTAAKAGHYDIVDILIEQRPNLNVIDADGQTALICAAKDGHGRIVTSLVNAGAYINIQDKSGDTCLICASRAGHTSIVDLLLKKYAELNHCGKEHKTALYWAVEKNHVDVVKLLLKAHADTEVATKDGDTPLLKSVRNRNLELVELLLQNKARITATDRKGDMCLHVAVRARSRKIIDVLLCNPKHSKLLYRPNKASETPYSIDLTHKSPILTDLFGARKLNANEENESRLGYELFSGVLADFLSDPTLSVPITVGLYSKWGSGKSFLLGKLTEEMRVFTYRWLDTTLTMSPFVTSCILHVALIAAALVAALSCNWYASVGVMAAVFILQLAAFLTLSRVGQSWDQKRLYSCNTTAASWFSYLQLVYRICFCRPPGEPGSDCGPVQIRYFFAERAKVLATGRGDVSVVQMLASLYEDVEKECGRMACRLYRAFRPVPSSSNRKITWRRACLVPHLFVFLAVVYLLLAVIMLTGFYFKADSSSKSAAPYQPDFETLNRTVESVDLSPSVSASVSESVDLLQSVLLSLIAALFAIICVLVLVNIVTIGRVFQSLLMPRSMHFKRLSRLRNHDEDRYVESLKNEVQLLINMVRCLDSFCGECSRLVVVVDGIDSCDQQKVVEVLDTINTLLVTPNSPFVILLSIDPHIVSKAVELNINKVFSHTAIGGREYLRSMIHLPFYLQNTTLRLINSARRAASTVSKLDLYGDGDHSNAIRKMSGRRLSGDSIATLTAVLPNYRKRAAKRYHSSRLRSCDSVASSVSSNLNRLGAGMVEESSDLNRVLLTDDYFSEINPRSMRRLINIIYVCGRLAKAFHIDFSWRHLASWINIIEQWPSRIIWLTLYIENNEGRVHDGTTLHDLYHRVKSYIPSSGDHLMWKCDGDEKKLETFLLFHKHSLTVSDVRLFLPFTVNLDPYLKKTIKEAYRDPAESQIGAKLLPASSSDQTTHVQLARAEFGAKLQHEPQHPETAPPPQSHVQWPALSQPTVSGETSCPAPIFSGVYPWTWASVQPAVACHQQMTGSCTTLMPAATAAIPPRAVELPSWCKSEATALSAMSVEQVCHLVAGLKTINPDNVEVYQQRLRQDNVNGWVLSACNLTDLKQIVNMSFGDWELFQAAVQQLRIQETQNMSAAAGDGLAGPQSRKQESIQEVHDLEHHESPIRLQVTSDCGDVTPVYSKKRENVSIVSTTDVTPPAVPDRQTTQRSSLSDIGKQETISATSSEASNSCFDIQSYLMCEGDVSQTDLDAAEQRRSSITAQSRRHSLRLSAPEAADRRRGKLYGSLRLPSITSMTSAAASVSSVCIDMDPMETVPAVTTNNQCDKDSSLSETYADASDKKAVIRFAFENRGYSSRPSSTEITML